MARLTDAELTRMRAEHVPVDSGIGDPRKICASPACWTGDDRGEFFATWWPCSTARLLAHFAPGPVPHLAGIAMGLMGPQDESELARN